MQLTIEISEETLDDIINDLSDYDPCSPSQSLVMYDVIRSVRCTPEYYARSKELADLHTYEMTRREDLRQP